MLGDSFHFTKEGVSNIQIPDAKQDVYKDTKEKGLILIVSYGGSKTYYFATTIQKEYHRIKVTSVWHNESVQGYEIKALQDNRNVIRLIFLTYD